MASTNLTLDLKSTKPHSVQHLASFFVCRMETITESYSEIPCEDKLT